MLDPMLEQVKSVLIEALRLDAQSPRASQWTAESPLLGSVPELDSMAVITVITALEDRFGIYIHDDEVSGDIFVTLESLTAFVREKIAAK